MYALDWNKLLLCSSKKYDIHYTHLKKGKKKFQGGGGVLKAQFSNESMMLNWNFWRGERVQATGEYRYFLELHNE